MRYITPHENLSLKSNNGKTAYQFNYGILDLGSGVEIDAIPGADTDEHLQFVAPIWAGGADPSSPTADEARELSGLGDLTDVTDLTVYKYKRLYYEAPIISTGTTTVSGDLGVYYKVLTGTVTYAGVTYATGEIFVSDDTTTTTSGTGTFSLWFNELLWDVAYQGTAEAFKNVHLNSGEEVTGYWGYTNGGSDARGFGYVTT